MCRDPTVHAMMFISFNRCHSMDGGGGRGYGVDPLD